MPETPRAETETEIERVLALETGRKLFAGDCRFLLGVASLDQLPDNALDEIAFAGRSNVGKSSLINALTGRNALARISNTPGRTQQINFFSLADRMVLVDLPGYGFAKAPKALVTAWTRLVNDFLRGRARLRRVCLLVDARHGLKANDLEIMAMLDSAAVAYRVVLTKADKIKAGALETLDAATAEALRTHPAALPDVLATSSEDGRGIAELRAELAAFADPG